VKTSQYSYYYSSSHSTISNPNVILGILWQTHVVKYLQKQIKIFKRVPKDFSFVPTSPTLHPPKCQKPSNFCLALVKLIPNESQSFQVGTNETPQFSLSFISHDTIQVVVSTSHKHPPLERHHRRKYLTRKPQPSPQTSLQIHDK
jgi:hypothetical protein